MTGRHALTNKEQTRDRSHFSHCDHRILRAGDSVHLRLREALSHGGERHRRIRFHRTDRLPLLVADPAGEFLS